MGCDIHIFVEYKTRGNWKKVGNIFARDLCVPLPLPRPLENIVANQTFHRKRRVVYTDQPYYGRNYNLFAILANVMNDCNFEQIHSIRGLPKNISKELKKKSDNFGEDGYSHSWYTLKELQKFDWYHKSTTHNGMINLEQYKIWKEKGKPEEWCKDVFGGNIKIISNEELEQVLFESSIIKKKNSQIKNILKKIGYFIPSKNDRYYTRINWIETYAESCSNFLTETIPLLEKLGKKPQNVRIVFWFDN